MHGKETYVDMVALMSRGKKIYHRNDLRMALSELGLPSRRILWLTLCQLDKDELGKIIFDEDKVYTVTAKMYADLCGLDDSVAYKQLKSGVIDIRTHLMRVPESDLMSKEEMERRNRPKDGVVLFTAARYGYYTDGEGFIEIQLDPVMKPFISRLDNNFTGQFLLSALRLADSNANKLYLLLREWISSGMIKHKDIELSELKKKLSLFDVKSYERFNLFKSSFFERAVKSIIETTEFNKIELEIIERKARKAHKVRISYEYEDYGQLNKSSAPKVSYPEYSGPSKRAIEMMKEMEKMKK